MSHNPQPRSSPASNPPPSMQSNYTLTLRDMQPRSPWGPAPIHCCGIGGPRVSGSSLLLRCKRFVSSSRQVNDESLECNDFASSRSTSSKSNQLFLGARRRSDGLHVRDTHFAEDTFRGNWRLRPRERFFCLYIFAKFSPCLSTCPAGFSGNDRRTIQRNLHRKFSRDA
jgi:hypothetical protein